MSYVIKKNLKKTDILLSFPNIIFFIYLCQRLNPDFQDVPFLYSLTAILLSCILLLKITFHDKIGFLKVIKNGYVVWIVLFTTLSLLSFTWSEVKATNSVNFFMTNLLTMIPLALFVSSEKRLNNILKIIVLASVFTCFYLLVFADISMVKIENAYRLAGDSESWNSNNIGIMCSISTILSFYLLRTSKKKIYLIPILLFTAVALMTGSRKTFIILVMGLSLYFVLSAKRGKFLYLMSSVVGVIFAYYMIMNVPFLYNSLGLRIESILGIFSDQGYMDSSTKTRMLMIEYGLQWYKQKPVLGVGIDNYRYLWESLTGVVMYAHNNYIELLVDLGTVGFVVYYSLYLKTAVRLFKNQKRNRKTCSLFLSILSVLMCVEVTLVSYNYRFIQIILCLAFCAATIDVGTQKELNPNIGIATGGNNEKAYY